MLMSVATNQSTRKHLMATPTTAAAPPIQRPRSRHTPRSRKPPRIILSVCLSILPPPIQNTADRDAMLYNSLWRSRDESTHSYISDFNGATQHGVGAQLPRTRPPTSA